MRGAAPCCIVAAQGGLHDLMLDLETPELNRRMAAWVNAQLQG